MFHHFMFRLSIASKRAKQSRRSLACMIHKASRWHWTAIDWISTSSMNAFGIRAFWWSRIRAVTAIRMRVSYGIW